MPTRTGDGRRDRAVFYGGRRAAWSVIEPYELDRDGDAEQVVDTVDGAPRTDEIGDAKVWLSALDDLVRIRTGERGPDAI
jgi:nitrogen regulatory protein PII